MNTAQNISIAAAFFAGVISFFSPCILPLIPTYFAYMTGISLKDMKERRDIRPLIFAHTLFFVIGFTVIFVMLGATATLIGNLLVEYQCLISRIGGIAVIIMGLYILGALNLPFLGAEKKSHVRYKPATLAGSFVIGIVFAAGWTPCVGPVLGSILLLASSQESVSVGILLLAFYSLGIGIPFLISSLAINVFLVLFNRYKKYLDIVNMVSGVFLIVVGIILLMRCSYWH